MITTDKKRRQSPANLNSLLEQKETLQNLIKYSKSKAYKNFFNSSKDSAQLWYRYHNVLGAKKTM